MLSESKLDILAITETHLDDETPIEDVMITGYQVARLDWKDQEGGGCIIYYSESLHIHKRDNLKTDIEAIWIDVTMKSQKLLLGCVYRPPDDYTFYNKFYSLLEDSVRNRKNVVILGDLNSDLIAKDYEGRRLLRILGSFDLHNVIKDPTRTTVTTSTLLDIMITTDISKIITSGTFDPDLSDHCLIYGIIRLQRKRIPPKYIFAKNYKQVNIETLKHAFITAPWSVIEAFDDPDDITWAWETLYKDIVNDHISQRRVKIRSDSLPWMNSHIRKTMNKRYNILKQAKETGSKEQWEEYKKLRNEVTKLLREAEAHYWRQEFKNTESSKDFWKLVAKITHTKKLNNIGPIVDDQGHMILEDKNKVEAMNDYFVAVGPNLASQINPIPNSGDIEHIYRITPTLSSVSVLDVSSLSNLTKPLAQTRLLLETYILLERPLLKASTLFLDIACLTLLFHPNGKYPECSPHTRRETKWSEEIIGLFKC